MERKGHAEDATLLFALTNSLTILPATSNITSNGFSNHNACVILYPGLSLTKSFIALENQPKDKDFLVPHRKTIRCNFCGSLKDICRNMFEKLLSLND